MKGIAEDVVEQVTGKDPEKMSSEDIINAGGEIIDKLGDMKKAQDEKKKAESESDKVQQKVVDVIDKVVGELASISEKKKDIVDKINEADSVEEAEKISNIIKGKISGLDNKDEIEIQKKETNDLFTFYAFLMVIVGLLIALLMVFKYYQNLKR